MLYRMLVVAASLLALAGPPSMAETAFHPPSEVAAAKNALALHAPLNALAKAGDRVVAAGQRGHVLLHDEGRGWVQADVPVSADLTALVFPTPQIGWAVGHEGVILRTEDGGATWRKQLDGRQVAELLARAYGKPGSASDPFLDVWFEDARRGWAVGAFNLILRTEDGGTSWTPWLDRTDNPKGLHLYAIRPAGGALFIVGEQGLVLKLDRERQRFVNVPLPYQGTLFGVVGTPEMTLVHGLRGNAYRSTDAGASWTRVETGVSAGLTNGMVRADGSVVLVSQAGHLLLSRDDGATFERASPANPGPAFAVAEAPRGAIVLAGMNGVRSETLKPAP